MQQDRENIKARKSVSREEHTTTSESEKLQQSPAAQLPARDFPVQTEFEQLIVGTVSIINPEGYTVTEFSAPVISGSWLALPTRACIGGNKWFFRVGDSAAIPIEGGIWGRGDAVGLWRLGGDRTFKGPKFDTWQQSQPVRLFSVKTGKLSQPTILIPSGVEGAFIYSFSSGIQDPGVFIQDDKVVGWSFGELLEGSFMWTLGNDSELVYENYVDDFYNETFAGGREEYFSIALSRGKDLSPQRQLQMFAEAFWVQPKLAPEDTPRSLSPSIIYPYITKLVNYIMEQGAYQYVVTLTEEPLLLEVADPELMANVCLAIQKIYGIEAALNFMEGTIENIEIAGDGSVLSELQLNLYLEWIANLLDTGELNRGWEVFKRASGRFGLSPRLHLQAVELTLASGDWSAAETLLNQREYPTELRGKRMLLADQISELKGQENKIVIRFQPGSRDLPVKATINNEHVQDFLIDTGATFVTIPFSTVEELGIEDQMSPHRQEVQTAGGPVYANAITLSSIKLGDWSVSDVQALVMPLPNRPGVGLLGLNYLNRFRMDLQADEGILILEPK